MRLSPIITRFGGFAGYEIEQRTTTRQDPSLRQVLILNLNGRALTYISKPWIAQVKANINFTATKSKYESGSSSSNSVQGDTGLYLVPYSRYPFEARLSRYQTYSGPGIGSLGAQTTRFDMAQRYTPLSRKERYNINYSRSLTEGDLSGTFRERGLNFGIDSSRFDRHMLALNGISERSHLSYYDRYRHNNIAQFLHSYRPNEAFSLNDNASIRTNFAYDPIRSNFSRYRELNSTASFQPRKARYSVIGTARAYVYDTSDENTSNQTRAINANLGGNYRPKQYVTLSASVNARVIEINSQRSSNVSTYQAASANYPLASFDLGTYHYNSRIYSNITNRTSSTGNRNLAGASQGGSEQSVSVNPSHSLSQSTMIGRSRLNLSLDQSLSATESTRKQATARLTHSATAKWSRSRNSLSLTGRDSRSLNNAQDSFQSISLSATTLEEISRYSSLSSSLNIMTTRQISNVSQGTSITFTNSSFNVRYNHTRAFDVPRLSFNSVLQASSATPVPVLVAPSDKQGAVIWGNSLQYQAGKLYTEFRADLSRAGNGDTQSLIYWSLKRYFW